MAKAPRALGAQVGPGFMDPTCFAGQMLSEKEFFWPKAQPCESAVSGFVRLRIWRGMNPWWMQEGKKQAVEVVLGFS